MYMCFNCASVTCLKSGSKIVCNECSFEIPESSYNRGIEYARKCFKFGIMYRSSYEDQYKRIKNSREFTMWSLDDPGDIQKFITLAILSGIIGNASWEVIRYVIRKIFTQLKETSNQNIIYFMDTFDFEYHKKMINDYYHFLHEVPIEVKRAIAEELIAEVVEKDDYPSPEEFVTKNMNSKKYYISRRDMAKKVFKKRLPSQYFSSFWTRFKK